MSFESLNIDDEYLECETIGDTAEIITSIAKFYNNEELSDIVLKVGSKRFHAHKFILLLMSDVFRTMCSKRWDSASIAEIELSECEQCIPVFPLFLHFLYHGEVKIKTTTALPLLMLADKYNVQPLKKCCETYIQQQVQGGNVAGAIRWLPYLQLCGHKDLEEACVEVIVVELECIIKKGDLLLLSFELLTHLLERDDLVVTSEYSLYAAVVNWIDVNKNSNSENHVDTLMPLIRFSMMLPENLIYIEKSTFYETNCSKISPFLALAHRYRSLVPDVVDELFSGFLYRPRNYTDPIWCQIVSIDADSMSFFNKMYNLQLTCEPLPCSIKPQEPTWQFQVLKRDGANSSTNRSAEGGLWNNGPSVVFAGKSCPSGYTLPLQVAVRPLKPVSSDMVVDVSLFRVKKDCIYKHLDTKTLTSSRGSSRKVSVKQNTPNSHFYFQTPEKLFQPSPMHFSFIATPGEKEPGVILKHDFHQNELDSPPEVPCVHFGPGFGHTIRPIHCIKLAVIIKPRFKSSNDYKIVTLENENLSSDTLPILG